MGHCSAAVSGTAEINRAQLSSDRSSNKSKATHEKQQLGPSMSHLLPAFACCLMIFFLDFGVFGLWCVYRIFQGFQTIVANGATSDPGSKKKPGMLMCDFFMFEL